MIAVMDELEPVHATIICRWCQWPLQLRGGVWRDDFHSTGCPASGPGKHWPVLPVPAALLPDVREWPYRETAEELF